jgi:7-carboxy-7-deazaguanine synthase
VKIIVESPESIARWTEAVGGQWSARHVWLHPEWSQRAQPEVLRAITDHVKSVGAPFRAGWQVHKPYAADSLDLRARPPAPLGGDLSKGF